MRTECSWQPLGYSSLDEMLKEELGTTEVDSIARVRELATTAQPLGEPRRPTNEERAEKGAIGTVTRGTNDSNYLTRRIARDHPEILERMKAGEFPSVRSAALEAGIVKPTFTCPIYQFANLAILCSTHLPAP